MGRIILFELKKLFRNRLMLVMLLIMSILNIYHIYSKYKEEILTEKDYYKAYFEIYDDVSGEWDTEKIEYVITEYEKAKAIIDSGDFSTKPNQPNTHTGYIFGDYSLFGQIKNEMETLYHYDDSMAELVGKASENVSFYREKSNSYQTELNRKIEEAYQNRSVSVFYDTTGMKKYLKYDFSTLLIIILLLPLLSPLFAKEHEIEMYGLLKLTPNFAKLSLCKTIAGTLAIVVVSIIFMLEDFFAFTCFYHIKGFELPIYALPDFFYSPLNMTLGTYLLMNAALKLLGFMVIGGICMLVSSLVRNEVLPFCISFAIALILVLSDAFIESDILSMCNPVTLFYCGRLFKGFHVTRIFDTPVYTFLLPILLSFAEWILLTVMTIVMQKARLHRSHSKRRCSHEI